MKLKRNTWIILALLAGILIIQVVVRIAERKQCNYRERYTKRFYQRFQPSSGQRYGRNAGPLDFFNQVLLPMEMHGMIINKFNDGCNHQMEVIDIDNGDSLFSLMTMSDFGARYRDQGLFDKAETGDSITKPAGSCRLVLKKNNLDSVILFDYSALQLPQ